MSTVDWIVLAAVAAAIGAALFFAIRRKRTGCCSGDCSDCSCGCAKKKN